MRIGILGAGNMAEALGGHWVRAGHDVMVSGRDSSKTAAVATMIGAQDGSWRAAADFGEVVLLAVPGQVVPVVLESVGLGLRDKAVIDCTNSIGEGLTFAGPIAERVATTTGARVVKAFNLCHQNVWRMAPPVFDGAPLTVPLCGDDDDALAAARSLVADLGCVPVDVGGLARAELLEAAAVFMISLWSSGVDPHAVVPPLTHAFGQPQAGSAD